MTAPGNTPNAPAWVQAVLPSEIPRQRLLGWPDFHPEDFCHICGRRNPVWFAPAADWTAVHGDSHAGIYCPPCFADLYADATGDTAAVWRFERWVPAS